jgi:hypothetical protein
MRGTRRKRLEDDPGNVQRAKPDNGSPLPTAPAFEDIPPEVWESEDRRFVSLFERHRALGEQISSRIIFGDTVEIDAGSEKAFISLDALTKLPNARKWLHEHTSLDIGESIIPGYTPEAPPSEAAVTPPLRMRDDLHITLLAARRLAAYEVLVRESDLTNRELAQGERLRRAGHLLLTYDRLREVRPDFKDTNDQLTAARRIQKAAYRERQRATRGLGPAVRGRPRKLHAS